MAKRNFDDIYQRVSDLKTKGVELYPKCTRTVTLGAFQEKYSNLKNEEVSENLECLAGRYVGKRKLAKEATYNTVYSLYGPGLTIKAYAKSDLSEDNISTTMSVMYGDLCGVVGYPFKEKNGDISIQIKSLKILAPCLHNDLPILPKVFSKFTAGSPRDAPLKPTVRAQKRYLDLVFNENAQGIFQTRSTIISYVRKFFHDQDFLEVETTILDRIPGVGAGAPFATKFNGIDYYLRVAPEVKLKMLLVAGFDRVFEIGKQFRNENIDATHHPEFTSCEAYMAFADYEDMMSLTETLLSGLVMELTGGYTVKVPSNDKKGSTVVIDFTPPFKRLDILEEFRESYHLSIPGDLCSTEANNYLMEACTNRGVVFNRPCRTARLLDKLIDHHLVPRCINPTFIVNHPTVMSSMAKSHQSTPEITERFELYINKKELCNSYTELNDPKEQRKRFSELLKELEDGDYKATQVDEEFCTSLEYGLPPAAGWGIGLDRLVMLLTFSEAIKDVILFPMPKTKKQKA